MIGSLGEIVFNVSSREALTFKDLNIEVSPRLGEHNPVMSIPKQEFIGMGAKSLTLTIDLNVGNKINPQEQYEKLLTSTNAGEVLPFFLGERAIGNFVIANLKIAGKIIDNLGRVLVASVSLSLKEYGDEENT